MLTSVRRALPAVLLALAAALPVAAQQKRGIDPSIDIRSVQGALSWPVEGKVFEKFGRQRNPKFATFTVNNGLKIEAVPGTQVRAVFQGTVLFSQWFKGYGNLIILKHDNNLLTAYAHNKTLLVKEGEPVTKGQKIAEAGQSDSDRPKLHFEVRKQGKPVDPMDYLPAR